MEDFGSTIFSEILNDLFLTKDYCNILLQGSYKPVSGKVIDVRHDMVTIENGYGITYLDIKKIIRITRYKRE
jgi:hypothetical protein